MSSFTTRKLTNDRVFVSGTDSFGTSGSTVLNATQWHAVTQHIAGDSATEEFNAAVEQFFAPLMEATEKFEAAQAGPADDPLTYVVLHEGTEGREAKQADVVHLGHDSVVLRLLETGNHDRLIWVGDQLEVLDVSEVNSSATEQAATEAATVLLKNQLGAEDVESEDNDSES